MQNKNNEKSLIEILKDRDVEVTDDEKVCLTDYYSKIDTLHGRFISDKVSGKVQTRYIIERIDGKYYTPITDFCQMVKRS